MFCSHNIRGNDVKKKKHPGKTLLIVMILFCETILFIRIALIKLRIIEKKIFII